MKIGAYPIFNFSGGVRKDKSPLELDKNELFEARNVELDKKGRVTVRRGSQLFGTDTGSDAIIASYVFTRSSTASNTRTTSFLRATNAGANTAAIEVLRTTRLTTSVATTDVTITVSSTTGFDASGTIEIDGDLITYTGLGGGGTTFTGCSGIRVAHSTSSPGSAAVHQWVPLTQPATNITGTAGVTFSTLNNICFINALDATKYINNNDAETLTDLGSPPAVLFMTNYRDRLYGAGAGSGASTTGLPYNVSFSARADGTSWTAADYFSVEDQRGEPVTGFRVLNDRLLIFKYNSTFTFDEVELKQRISHVGAWNNKVPVEIDGLIYTFCPEGIFATNGVEAKNIGEPVRQFWENARPTFDTNRRVETLFSAARIGKKYCLYLREGDVGQLTSLQNIILAYDTQTKHWEVWTGFSTSIGHLISFNRWRDSDAESQNIHAAFFGAFSGQMYRLFENRNYDTNTALRGSDVFSDLIADNAGVPVSAYIETPLYDLTRPELYKKFNEFLAYVESGTWHVSYRVMNTRGVSEYRPLGTIKYPYTKLSFPAEAQGWRIGFRIAAYGENNASVFNGFILNNTEVIPA